MVHRASHIFIGQGTLIILEKMSDKMEKNTLWTIICGLVLLILFGGIDIAISDTLKNNASPVEDIITPKNNIQASHLTAEKVTNYLNDPTTVKTRVVNGASMQPSFFSGNILLITEVEDVTILNEGDIIVFQKDGNYLAHRIRAIYPDHIITQGDANYQREKININETIELVFGVLYA